MAHWYISFNNDFFFLLLFVLLGDGENALPPWLKTTLTNQQTHREVLFDQMHALGPQSSVLK